MSTIRTTRRSRRLRPLVGAVLGAVLLAGCGYAATPVPQPEASAAAEPPAPAAPPTCDDALSSYAPDNQPDPASVQAIRERGRLIAGVSADTYLMGSRNPFTGALEGFDIDFVKQITAAIFDGDSTRYELRVITAADRLPVLQDDSVDVVVRNMTINCERWEEIAFSAEYYRSGQKLLVRSNETAIDGLEDLADVRVCAPAGTSSLANLVALAPEAIPVPANSHTACLLKFQQGEIDAITGDDTVLAGLAAQDPYAVVVGDTVTDEPYGIGVNADRVDLVRFINGVLQRMRQDGSWESSYQTWLAPALGASPGQPQPVYGRTP